VRHGRCWTKSVAGAWPKPYCRPLHLPRAMKATLGLSGLTKRVIAFRDARDWQQFHNPKDVAVSLSLEAAEYLELFQWKAEKEQRAVDRTRAGEELADVLYWVLLAANDLGIDLVEALDRKLGSNEAKYPVAKSRGRSTKYSEL
jgi:NTP pyrophosphatase (non-canonical NTP hydrolase)